MDHFVVFLIYYNFALVLCFGFFFCFFFWSWGMWEINSLSRDRTQTPCIGRQSLKHWKPPKVIFQTNRADLSSGQLSLPSSNPLTPGFSHFQGEAPTQPAMKLRALSKRANYAGSSLCGHVRAGSQMLAANPNPITLPPLPHWFEGHSCGLLNSNLF